MHRRQGWPKNQFWTIRNIFRKKYNSIDWRVKKRFAGQIIRFWKIFFTSYLLHVRAVLVGTTCHYYFRCRYVATSVWAVTYYMLGHMSAYCRQRRQFVYTVHIISTSIHALRVLIRRRIHLIHSENIMLIYPLFSFNTILSNACMFIVFLALVYIVADSATADFINETFSIHFVSYGSTCRLRRRLTPSIHCVIRHF